MYWALWSQGTILGDGEIARQTRIPTEAEKEATKEAHRSLKKLARQSGVILVDDNSCCLGCGGYIAPGSYDDPHTCKKGKRG